MPDNLNFSADRLVLSPKCRRRYLHTNHPDAKPIRDRHITLASICEISEYGEVERNDPNMHVLIITLEGQGRLFTEELRKGMPLEAGHLTILPAHQRHYYRLDGSQWLAIWIYLADTPLWAHLGRQKAHTRISQSGREICAAIEGFLAENIRTGSRARMAARHYAELILLNIERELEVEDNFTSQKMRQDLYSLWEIVNDDLGRHWRVSDLADRVGISPQHLYRVSMRFFACKPMEMVKRLRMQRAQDFLSSIDLPIKTIAQRVGYGDPFSFSAAFKRYCGCSPREFRTRSQEKLKEPIKM